MTSTRSTAVAMEPALLDADITVQEFMRRGRRLADVSERFYRENGALKRSSIPVSDLEEVCRALLSSGSGHWADWKIRDLERLVEKLCGVPSIHCNQNWGAWGAWQSVEDVLIDLVSEHPDEQEDFM
mmetsp:Transcript_6302/g.13877  ORF Transcript_6302/g.13877 Transcript_6302/m.13877 type:complete len:127 (+) Transcript_6302:70-450(+)